MEMSRTLKLARLGLAVLVGAAAGSGAIAQSDQMVAIPTPVQPTAIVLGTGPLPGATAPVRPVSSSLGWLAGGGGLLLVGGGAAGALGLRSRRVRVRMQ